MTKLTKWIIPTMPVFLVATLVSGCATKAESTEPVAISNPSVYAGLECVYWDKHFSEQTRLCQVGTLMVCQSNGAWSPVGTTPCVQGPPPSVIHVTRAIWYAFDNENNACGIMPTVTKLCNGYEKCTIDSALGMCDGGYGSPDPAPGHQKKLLIRYQCQKGTELSNAKTVIDAQIATLSCP